MTDPIYADPRLAAIYDDIDDDRSDLDHYEVIIESLGADSVIDVGCGTGELACRLARRGFAVTGVDPAAASLDVARTKPGAEQVTWMLGDATDLPEIFVDVATMTGNVAQVFVTDMAWQSTLLAIRGALRTGGHAVFEARDPAWQGWEEWTRDNTISVRSTTAGPVECWVAFTKVELPLVSFRWTYRFLDIGKEISSDSTLRFRDRGEIVASLMNNGFVVEEVRDAPDRPGRELVFIARSTDVVLPH